MLDSWGRPSRFSVTRTLLLVWLARRGSRDMPGTLRPRPRSRSTGGRVEPPKARVPREAPIGGGQAASVRDGRRRQVRVGYQVAANATVAVHQAAEGLPGLLTGHDPPGARGRAHPRHEGQGRCRRRRVGDEPGVGHDPDEAREDDVVQRQLILPVDDPREPARVHLVLVDLADREAVWAALDDLP